MKNNNKMTILEAPMKKRIVEKIGNENEHTISGATTTLKVKGSSLFVSID
jgi:hypothetical protein